MASINWSYREDAGNYLIDFVKNNAFSGKRENRKKADGIQEVGG
jgi:hypothetical protein